MSERSCSPNPSTPPPVDAISITIRTTNPVSGTTMHVDLGDGASDGHPALTAIRAIIVNADRLRIRAVTIRSHSMRSYVHRSTLMLCAHDANCRAIGSLL